jgi:lipopolysaccharide/colanic/teichoic acid biosynthesis glycosyltransferase
MTERHIPLLNKWMLRTALGLTCAAVSPLLAALALGREFSEYTLILAMVGLGWLPAVLLTDKYVHKYPQRYTTYLLATHAKAALIMAFVYVLIRLIAGPAAAPMDLLFTSLLIFALADLLLSLPRRDAPVPPAKNDTTAGTNNQAPGDEAVSELATIDSAAIQKVVAEDIDALLRGFLQENLPESDKGIGSALVFDDLPADDEQTSRPEEVGLLVGRTPLNNVVRLNLFLQYCSRQLAMGGYLAVKYTPLDVVTRRLRERHQGIRYKVAFLSHFIWYRAIPKLPWLDRLYFSPLFSWIDRFFLGKSKLRTRVLSSAEVWGRLAYYGMEVIAESDGDERFVLARRVSPPVSNRRPSYYAVVALEKVGLDGESISLHKVRSMYPFSEFLQKRIFESHGLSEVGKFRNDPRLTDYGPMIRSNWIDELPGLYDWLRGDVKLVGMRATSPQFLSLYPQELYDLYIQIKPGLIPPIFDESTDGFDEIVRIEMDYLERYRADPIKTDIQYFWFTFRDIVFRKVRSN